MAKKHANRTGGKGRSTGEAKSDPGGTRGEPDDAGMLAREAAAQGMVKIALRDPDGDFETPWATPIGGTRYRLENTPFFAYGMSWNDIVEAEIAPQEHPTLPVVRRLVEKGGHRTVRVAGQDQDVPEELIATLVGLGATYEGVNPAYLCFDLEPAVDLDAVVEELQHWPPDAIAWEHADPTWEELYGEPR